MTCAPVRFTNTSIENTFDFIGRNFLAGESDEFSFGDENFARQIVPYDENFA